MTGTRSSGCQTCKRRRIKCDESKPTCNRCRSAGYECPGYGRPAAFIDDWKQQDHNATLQLDRTKRLAQLSTRRQGSSTDPGGPSTQPSLDPQRQEQYLTFFVSKLFSQRKADDMQSWYILKLKNLPSNASIALQALSTYFFGRYHNSSDVMQQGISFYGYAVSQLQRDLQGPTPHHVSTLIVTSLLASYEMVGTKLSPAWIQHAGGLAGLIEARGPTSHAHGTARAVFLDQRTLLISEAILNRKATFLSKPEWKTLPWNHEPETKTPFDSLLDIAADCAHHRKNIKSTQVTGSPENIMTYLQDIQNSLGQLNEWWVGWSADVADRILETPPDLSLNINYDDEGPVFSTVFRWPDFWTCYVTIIYNALRIILLQCRNEADVWATNYGLETTTAPSHGDSRYGCFGIIDDPKMLALGIIKSSEELEAHGRRFFGPFCLLLPFKFALESLDPESREARWLRDLPRKNLASYRRAADEPGSRVAMPTCGCMMIDTVVSNQESSQAT